MNKRISLVIAGVAAASVLAGGAAYGAVSSIPDSAGVVHGCYDSGGNLKVIDTSVTATCPKGYSPLNWNQTGLPGSPGDQGAPGLPGLPGQQGPAGPGYVFTTGSGTDGPQLTQDGYYFVVVSGVITNNSVSPLFGDCEIGSLTGFPAPELLGFNEAFNIQGAAGSRPYEFSGIIKVIGGSSSISPVTPELSCMDMSGNAVAVPDHNLQWWVSPVTTS